jgi:hypothetical protein
MRRARAEIVHEYGPFPDAKVAGVTYDGRELWFASDDKLNAVDPANGELRRSLDVPANAGTAFDGRHLYQIGNDRIQKLDAKTGAVVATVPAPGTGLSGLAWAEGSLWVGVYKERRIYEIDPESGAVLRTIESNRFVTGVAWVDKELWHGTWEDDQSEIRRVDAVTGEVAEVLEMPEGLLVSGLDSDGKDRLFCGGGTSGKVRVVRRPKRAT